jgi:hypothetical protein
VTFRGALLPARLLLFLAEASYVVVLRSLETAAEVGALAIDAFEGERGGRRSRP